MIKCNVGSIANLDGTNETMVDVPFKPSAIDVGIGLGFILVGAGYLIYSSWKNGALASVTEEMNTLVGMEIAKPQINT